MEEITVFNGNSLFWDVTLVEIDIPELFVCRDYLGKRYLFLCIDDEEYEYIFRQIDLSRLIDLIKGEITMRSVWIEDVELYRLKAGNGASDDLIVSIQKDELEDIILPNDVPYEANDDLNQYIENLEIRDQMHRLVERYVEMNLSVNLDMRKNKKSMHTVYLTSDKMVLNSLLSLGAGRERHNKHRRRKKQKKGYTVIEDNIVRLAT